MVLVTLGGAVAEAISFKSSSLSKSLDAALVEPVFRFFTGGLITMSSVSSLSKLLALVLDLTSVSLEIETIFSTGCKEGSGFDSIGSGFETFSSVLTISES